MATSKTRNEKLFHLFGLSIASLGIAMVMVFLVGIILDGFERLSWDFLTGYPSRRAASAGIAPALLGSFYFIILTAIFSMPLSVGAAVYLEEYAPKNWFTSFIELNIANLAGVPSVIFGILGLELFVRGLDLGRSLIAGALMMSLLVMPIIIISSREAIRRVPRTIREAAFALGATRWEVVRDQVVPSSLPGILTGCILAFSRAVGETAPLVTLGALTYMPFLPDSVFSPFTVLPIQAFNWISRPQTEFHQNAAASIVMLLAVLLTLNLVAIILRQKFERRYDAA